MRIALVGNPNCGKSTLFNVLTHATLQVGNWPGVTVECVSGEMQHHAEAFQLVDLPGTYSLTPSTDHEAVDASIARHFILEHEIDAVINVVDASLLERHLYLTTQLLEMGLPVVVALNMMDVAKARDIQIDVERLSQMLGCPVVPIEARSGKGVEGLKEIATHASAPCHCEERKARRSNLPLSTCHCEECEARRSNLLPLQEMEIATLPPVARDDRRHEGDRHASAPCHCEERKARRSNLPLLQEIATLPPVARDDRRHEGDRHASAPCHCEERKARRSNLPLLQEIATLPPVARDDRCGEEIATHASRARDDRHDEEIASSQKTLLAMTKAPFGLLAMTSASERYHFISDIITQCVKIPSTTKPTLTDRLDRFALSRIWGLPIFFGVMYLLFAFGIQIGGYFQTYFDRVSQFIFVDQVSQLLIHYHAPDWCIVLLANGLGKGLNTVITFIPVLAAMFLFLALLEDSGYMTRAVFLVDRAMQSLGLPGKALVPMIVGFGCNVPAVMATRTLAHHRDRILSILMMPFMSCSARLTIYAVFAAAFFPHSGQNIVFALYVMGIMMALFTGFLLRKTLLQGNPSSLVMELPTYHAPHFKTLLNSAWRRLHGFVFRAGKLIIPICILIEVLNTFHTDGSVQVGGDANSILSMIGQWITPLFAPMGIHQDNWPATVGLITGVLAKEVVMGTLNTLYAQMGDVYGSMYHLFDGKAGAFAYLLFILLYFPCISTMAAMLREMHRGWVLFSAFWMIGIAYGVSVAFYQAASFRAHPLSSSLWLFGVASILMGIIFSMRWLSEQKIWLDQSDKLNCAKTTLCSSGTGCLQCPLRRV